METNPEFGQIDESAPCFRCGGYPRIFCEILFSKPEIVSFYYKCACGERTGNFATADLAQAVWRQRYSLIRPVKIQKNA